MVDAPRKGFLAAAPRIVHARPAQVGILPEEILRQHLRVGAGEDCVQLEFLEDGHFRQQKFAVLGHPLRRQKGSKLGRRKEGPLGSHIRAILMPGTARAYRVDGVPFRNTPKSTCTFP